MFRYVAVIWEQTDEAQARAANVISQRLLDVSPDLHVTFDRQGMKVLCAFTQTRRTVGACHLSGTSGVVLGTLFRAPAREDSSGPQLTSLEEHESRSILRTRGKLLVERYWGRYVAFLYDADSAEKVIVRDSMGGLPCFLTKLDGATVAFSSLTDCLDTGLFRFTLNWSHIACRVALSSIPLNQTGLNECTELRPGNCLRIADGHSRVVELWMPFEAALNQPIEDVETAAREVRATAQACANSWASCYDNIILELSGGLDSSIVAACLRNASPKPRVTALKFSAGALAGERRRARLVAERMGYHLEEIEVHWSPIPVDRLLAAEPTVNLELDVGTADLADAKLAMASKLGAAGIFNGHPGDILFGAGSKEFGTAAYIHRHGMDIKAMKVALDVALMTDRSWWAVLADGIRTARSHRVWETPRLVMAHRHLLADDARHVVENEPDLYALPCGSGHLPPGIVEYLVNFTGGVGVEFHNAFRARNSAVDPDPVYLLRSQPLVEVCLRIPPYVHNAGGRERWVARRAFQDTVPSEIVSTLWKDPAPGTAHALLLQSTASLRELLGDGILVRENILDKRKLHEALSLGPVRRMSFPTELHDHFIAELWVRRVSAAIHDVRVSTAMAEMACAS